MATSTIPNDMYVGKAFNNVDARTTFANIALGGSKTMNITLSNYFRGMMLILSGNVKGLYLVHTTSTGITGYETVLEGSGITLSTSSQTLTVSNTTVSTVIINFLILQGNVNAVAEQT